MVPIIPSIIDLTADQAVASSVVPVDITGFTFALGAAKRLTWQVKALFTLGATGGFRFLAHMTTAPTTYNAAFRIAQAGATFDFMQAAEAAVANASAVATTYLLDAWGYVLANTAGTFSFQFAQNGADVLPITILKGATFSVQLFK